MKAPVYDRLARVAGAKRGRLLIDVALKHENQVLDTGFKNDLLETEVDWNDNWHIMTRGQSDLLQVDLS